MGPSTFKKKYIKLTSNNRLHNLEIPIIGLTGGIASGKSTVSQILHKQKYCVINADSLIKRIYQEPATLDFISQLAPHIVSQNKINFKTLREVFFKDQKIQEQIESFLYPQMKTFFIKELDEFKKNNRPNFVIYDVPLLFEKKLDALVDLKVLVYCPQRMQIERLISRDKISEEMAKNIIAHQISIEDKKIRCDFIIDNQKGHEELLAETLSICKLILD